ncbi:MAG: UDP-4-amino-4,6-dideoxy-N-acetyl-beta-L-altrosamine N-acetyltransferase [Halocynthiibacter sp.]
MKHVRLTDITAGTKEQQNAVLNIRNHPNVRSNMYTDHVISLDEHHTWIDSLKTSPHHIVFMVLVDGVVSGVASINALDRQHKKSDWAFYLDESARGGLGAVLEITMLDFAFNDLALEKLNCEVIETNLNVVQMHEKFGFQREGFFRSNIEKNGARIGVYRLGITRAEWHQKKASIVEKYASRLDNFSITLNYEDDKNG